MTYTVTNAKDSGPGSLRQAIVDANNNPGPDTIAFNIPTYDPNNGWRTKGVWTITLASSLPSLTGNGTTIDGNTQALSQGDTNPMGPEVEVHGGFLNPTAVVFYIESSQNTIKGLAINGFVNQSDGYTRPGTGIRINAAVSGNTIQNNYIGTTATGQYDSPNNTGIEILNGANNNLTESNVIAGNTLDGVFVGGSGTDSNKFRNNLIGASLWVLYPIPNGRHGIFIQNGPLANVIGGGSSFQNRICGNAQHGILINNAQFNEVSYNYIGISCAGQIVMGNGYSGIAIDGGATDSFVYANLIAGNKQHGVLINGSGTNNNAVQGNSIGTVEGVKLPNGWHGVGIYSGAASNLVGHINDASRGNVIGGNGWSGVAIVGSSNNTVANNAIGTHSASTALNLSNGYYGVHVVGGSNNAIGPSNIIAYNSSDGVRIDGVTALYNRITQNSIFSNVGKGIENINGGNGEPFTPNISQATCLLVQGSAPAGSTVEIFSDASDQGRIHEGSTTANAILPVFAWNGTLRGPNVTVTYITSQGNTSEFGVAHSACCRLFLPLVLR